MRLVFLLACAGLLCACSSTTASEPAPEPTESSGPVQAPAEGSAATARPESGAGSTSTGGELTFAPRGDWIVEAPSNSMRKAQYRLPGAEGEAELVVFYFGPGQGGGVDANVARWATQFTQPDGSDTADAVLRSERRVAGMPVHEVSIWGTYVAETSPGSGERVDRPGWGLLAAIVDSDHGPYYLKLVGPAGTVKARAGEFRGFVSELR